MRNGYKKYKTADDVYARCTLSDTGCRLWNGGLGLDGYGQLSVGGRTRRAHRVVWELSNGPIPKGLVVMHSCDTPKCVTLEHLSLGTHADNHADRNRKGRQAHGETSGRRRRPECWDSKKWRGTANGASKINEDTVRLIRAAAGPMRAIAQSFSVSQTLVAKIKNRAAWAWVS